MRTYRTKMIKSVTQKWTSAKVLKVTSTGAQPPTWEPFSILDTCTVHTGE